MTDQIVHGDKFELVGVAAVDYMPCKKKVVR